MKQLHTIQLHLLQELLYEKKALFSYLQETLDLPSNQIAHHLHKLIQDGLIYKDMEWYFLTNPGKEYANTMDTWELSVKKQAKLGVLICTTRDVPWTLWGLEYLLYTRLKEPFYGCQWLPTWKIHWWESPTETASRELMEEAALTWPATLIKCIHMLESISGEDEIVEDKYLFLCHIHNPVWELTSSREWTFERIPEEEVLTWIKKPFHSVSEIEDIILSTKTLMWSWDWYDERRYTDSKF